MSKADSIMSPTLIPAPVNNEFQSYNPGEKIIMTSKREEKYRASVSVAKK